MLIKSLYIKEYKILKDFKLDCKAKPITIFIGDNGSGKSTILEAIAEIFKSFFLRQSSKFEFKLVYWIQVAGFGSIKENMNLEIELKSIKNQYIRMSILNNEALQKIPSDSYSLSEKEMLSPSKIILYYSGYSETLREISQSDSESFFYFQRQHFPIILLTLLASNNQNTQAFLKAKAKIKSIQKVFIVLKHDFIDGIQSRYRPQKTLPGNPDTVEAESDTYKFLSYLITNSADMTSLGYVTNFKGTGKIIIQNTVDKRGDHRKSMIMLTGQAQLFDLRSHLGGEDKLFQALNVLLEKYIEKITFVFKKEDNSYFDVLSEGEKQAITIRGLTELFGSKNNLLLFDEPDAYLHPKWQREFIPQVAETFETEPPSENAYLIATHSPLLLGDANPKYSLVKSIEAGILKDYEDGYYYYGRDNHNILRNLMRVQTRNPKIDAAIKQLYRLIAEDKLEGAEQKLKDLQAEIGPDDPKLVAASVEIEYAKEGL